MPPPKQDIEMLLDPSDAGQTLLETALNDRDGIYAMEIEFPAGSRIKKEYSEVTVDKLTRGVLDGSKLKRTASVTQKPLTATEYVVFGATA